MILWNFIYFPQSSIIMATVSVTDIFPAQDNAAFEIFWNNSILSTAQKAIGLYYFYPNNSLDLNAQLDKLNRDGITYRLLILNWGVVILEFKGVPPIYPPSNIQSLEVLVHFLVRQYTAQGEHVTHHNFPTYLQPPNRQYQYLER